MLDATQTKNLFGWQDWPPAPDNSSYPNIPGWKGCDTSRDAALAIARTAKTIRADVLRLYVNFYPRALTADQIAAELGANILTIRPRVSELHMARLLERVPERRKNESGMTAACWRATGNALAGANNA